MIAKNTLVVPNPKQQLFLEHLVHYLESFLYQPITLYFIVYKLLRIKWPFFKDENKQIPEPLQTPELKVHDPLIK